eukprot:382387-Amphidinium_carterae.1
MDRPKRQIVLKLRAKRFSIGCVFLCVVDNCGKLLARAAFPSCSGASVVQLEALATCTPSGECLHKFSHSLHGKKHPKTSERRPFVTADDNKLISVRIILSIGIDRVSLWSQQDANSSHERLRFQQELLRASGFGFSIELGMMVMMMIMMMMMIAMPLFRTEESTHTHAKESTTETRKTFFPMMF